MARKAVGLAELAHDAGQDSAHAHVGYFLIDKGLHQLEGEVFCRLNAGEWLRRAG